MHGKGFLLASLKACAAVLGAFVMRRKGLQEFQTLGNILVRELPLRQVRRA